MLWLRGVPTHALPLTNRDIVLLSDAAKPYFRQIADQLGTACVVVQAPYEPTQGCAYVLVRGAMLQIPLDDY